MAPIARQSRYRLIQWPRAAFEAQLKNTAASVPRLVSGVEVVGWACGTKRRVIRRILAPRGFRAALRFGHGASGHANGAGPAAFSGARQDRGARARCADRARAAR